MLLKYLFPVGFVDFCWYYFNITFLLLVEGSGSFNIGPRYRSAFHDFQYCYDPLS